MRKVMLVEDEDLILQGLEHIIDWEALGFTIIHKAHNGAEALEMLKKENVDIIITDVCMPLMDGLQFLERLRLTDSVTRAIVVTGCNEFEHVRSALRLDVQDYILKPISGEELIQSLKRCRQYLEQKEMQESILIDGQVEQMQFLKGVMDEEQRRRYLEKNGIKQEAGAAYAAIMRVEVCAERHLKITGVIGFLSSVQADGKLIVRHLQGNLILLLLCLDEVPAVPPSGWFAKLQNDLEIQLGIRSFVTLSASFTQLTELPKVYQTIEKLQKYILVDGYGSCVDETSLKNRIYTGASVDCERLFRLITQRDLEAVGQYIEDLFVGNLQEKIDVEVFYRIAVRIALLLQEIRTEYNLPEEGRQISDMLVSIYRAEDLLSLKVLLLSEIEDIISWINTENAQYTPVVRQIMSEVKNSYKEDMNLKTLAGKYHMNSSYLGQIFQKEVGCPFSQYLNTVRNQIAKELILTTNMKISDIAKEAGFADTSYFYRKFKQVYGVSPSVIREMKNY